MRFIFLTVSVIFFGILTSHWNLPNVFSSENSLICLLILSLYAIFLDVVKK